VRIIVGYAAGGPTDISARLEGQWLSERLRQSFVIDNRPGAASNISTELVVRALPDGYTLLQVGTTNAINAILYDNLNFNFIRDIAPVASMMRTTNVMVVQPSFPAKSVPSSLPMPRRIRARSIWRMPASGVHHMFTVSCSRRWPASI
jgi:tripartite-type tricarboxylate transporter receptor subunit TctC